MARDQGRDPIADLMARSEPALVRALQAADAARATSSGRYKQAVEADLKNAVHAVMGTQASTVGLALRATERAISPELWPRVGNVDVELRARADPGWAAFMELKWARTDKLWHCVWDLAKAALVAHVGLANRALLLVGATAAERATHYGAILDPHEWSTRTFLKRFEDAMRPFCFAEGDDVHPTGPYALPESFAVAVLGRTDRFSLRGNEWTLTLLEVTTPHEARLVDLDDRCVPRS